MLALTAGAAYGIDGVVTDAETGQPIAGAIVKVKGENIGAVTDSKGEFSVTGYLAGEPTLVASVIGYKVAYRTVEKGGAEIVFALEPKLLKGQNIIVTATRASKGETPAAFTNISSAELDEKYFVQDIPMLLADTPNLYAYSDAGNGIGYSYLKLRGFNQNRVAVLINGIPLNGAESHEVYWVDLPDFANSIQDIQVQRGVGSNLYGQSALGGTVNLVTNDYSTVPWLKSESGFGSYNTKKFTISGNSGLINDSYAFYSRFSRMETDGYRNNSWVDTYSYFIGAARYDNNMTWKFNAYGGPEELHLAYKGITAEQLETNRRYNEFEYKDEIDHFNQPHYELFHDWSLNDNIDFSNTLYYFNGEGFYNQYREDQDLAEHNIGAFYDFDTWIMYTDSDTTFPIDYYTNYDSAGNPLADTSGDNAGYYALSTTTTDLVRKPVVKEYDWGWIPRLTLKHDKGEITLGGEMRIHSSHHYGEILWAEVYPQGYQPNIRYHDYEGKSNTFTVYAHNKYKPLEKVILIASLQYQRHNYRLENDKRYNVTFNRNYDFVSPRFGITYNLTDYANIYTSISGASRQPTLYDIYNPQDFWSNPDYRFINFAGSGPGLEYVGKELKPEKLIDIELGGDFQKDLSGAYIKGDINFYRMEIRYELVPYAGQIDDMNLPMAGNAEKTIHQGIELSWLASLKNGLTFGGNFSANDDHFEDYREFGWDGRSIDLSENRIGGFPKMMLYYKAKYSAKNMNFIIDGKYRGTQFIDNAEQNELESYNVLNGTVMYDFGSHVGFNSLKASLRIQNLLDKEFVQAGYADWTDGLPRYMVGAERNLYLSIEIGI